MYTEREIRLGHNLACISKPQKWHISSKRQEKLHKTSFLNDTHILKPKIHQILKGNSTVRFHKKKKANLILVLIVLIHPDQLLILWLPFIVGTCLFNCFFKNFYRDFKLLFMKEILLKKLLENKVKSHNGKSFVKGA